MSSLMSFRNSRTAEAVQAPYALLSAKSARRLLASKLDESRYTPTTR